MFKYTKLYRNLLPEKTTPMKPFFYSFLLVYEFSNLKILIKKLMGSVKLQITKKISALPRAHNTFAKVFYNFTVYYKNQKIS